MGFKFYKGSEFTVLYMEAIRGPQGILIEVGDGKSSIHPHHLQTSS